MLADHNYDTLFINQKVQVFTERFYNGDVECDVMDLHEKMFSEINIKLSDNHM